MKSYLIWSIGYLLFVQSIEIHFHFGKFAIAIAMTPHPSSLLSLEAPLITNTNIEHNI
jgi:hypothetical protein